MHEMNFTIKCHGHELQTVFRVVMQRYNHLTKFSKKDLYVQNELKVLGKMIVLLRECLNKWENEIGRL